MEYKGTLIAVSNLEQSVKFYTELLDQKIEMDLGWNIAFSSGLSIQLNYDLLCDFAKETIIQKPHNMELYFEVEDFDHLMKKLDNYPKLKYLHPPKVYDWGQRVVRIYDPDYHIIEIGESMEFVVKRFILEGLTNEQVQQKSQMPMQMIEKVRKSID